MSRQTSALRDEGALSDDGAKLLPANCQGRPLQSFERLTAALAELSLDELAAFEDDLDFYAFTGIASPLIKRLEALLPTEAEKDAVSSCRPRRERPSGNTASV